MQVCMHLFHQGFLCACLVCVHAPYRVSQHLFKCVSVARAEYQRALLQLMKTGRASSIWPTRALQSPRRNLQTSVLCGTFLIRHQKCFKVKHTHAHGSCQEDTLCFFSVLGSNLCAFRPYITACSRALSLSPELCDRLRGYC